ncbi:MAG TPA: glycosyltransferase family 2 protein [Woeseiaceae bacterium]|nr:glycosyltransferase family 2 protein [Woeseiaceae bacterium]
MTTPSRRLWLPGIFRRMSATGRSDLQLSVVIPVCNEAGNVATLASEISTALDGRLHFEVLFVDDGSSDATAAEVLKVRDGSSSPIRLLQHDKCIGQSAGIRTGVLAAKAPWIATLDGDGQNDPADIPLLIEALQDYDADGKLKLVMGNRTTRRDTLLRRFSSRVANAVRSTVLHDGTPDTGCGIKLFERDMFLQLPHFNHMHRFLPALVQRAGHRVISVPVNHRPRMRGASKYGVGNRLWVGIVDLFGVMWLIRRRIVPLTATEEHLSHQAGSPFREQRTM